MKVRSKNASGTKKTGKAQESETSVNTHSEPDGSPTAEPNMSESATQPGPDQEFVVDSAEETFELGRSIAASLTGPAIILVSGDLGAGKTVFAKGAAAGLDIDPADITSPSFTLINIHDGRLRLYHIDLYRLDRASCASLGLDEIFEDPRGVIVIEWPERLPVLSQRAMRVRIEYLTESSRKILMTAGPEGVARRFR